MLWARHGVAEITSLGDARADDLSICFAFSNTLVSATRRGFS